MKNKMLACMVVLALVVTGCVAIKNAGQSIEQFVCDPPANVVGLVNLGEPFILAALSIAVPGSSAYIQAFEAYGGMAAVQAGVCATVKQVNSLIVLLSGPKAIPGTKMVSPAFDTKPLSDWLKAKGK